MKFLVLTLGILGAIVFLLAVFAKLNGMPVVEFLGFAFSRVGIVLVANFLLLAAIFIHLLNQK
jgi:hypothetical protein